MKNNFRLSVFICAFFLYLFLPKLDAGQEAVEELPFSNPDTLISMDFQDANLKDILKIFSIQSGLNFIASDAVRDRQFTLYFDSVPIKDAMDKIFKANNLSYDFDKKSNIFIVNDMGAPEVQTITKVFYLKFASVSKSPFVNEKDTGKVITDISDVGGGGGGEGTSTKEASISNVVEKLLSDRGKLVEDYRTNSLIVTDVPNRVALIAEIIASLDIPQPQVLLEVEMLDVFKDTTDKIGLKFGTSPLTLNTILQGASWGTKFPFGSLFGNRNYGGGPTYGTFKVNTETAGSTYGAASTYQIVLDFIKTQAGTRYLARPRILTLNNETAEIKIVASESVGVTSTTAGSAGGTSTVTASAERATTGVLLRVTPQVNLDTNEITMFVIPAVGESSTGGTFTITGVGTVTFKDPELRYTKSAVRVKDGETIVIGGLIRRNFSETITKLPFFGDLPLLGRFFTHRYKDKDRDRELLVFITPHIVRDTSVQLAQAKKGVLPEREQSTTSRVGRQAVIDASLKSFEKKKK